MLDSYSRNEGPSMLDVAAIATAQIHGFYTVRWWRRTHGVWMDPCDPNIKTGRSFY